ncbi:MAG: DUF4118 domain-containing protein [Streptosporangiaceae bacterium]
MVRFFFTLPYYRFTIRSPADVTTAVLLLVTGLAVSQLAARARRLKVIAVTDAGLPRGDPRDCFAGEVSHGP